jgi:integrase
MSKVRGIYQRGGSGEWLYDLQIRGHRFCGSTGTANRREAERWIATFRTKKKAEVAEFSGAAPMTFGVASTRWWEERGQHRKDSRDIERFLGWLQAQIGNKTAVAAIDNNMVARLVATRRAEDVSPATVNRSVTEPLRAIMTRAGEFWGQSVQKIHWGGHKLAEPQQRVREASAAEEAKLFAALRPDFHPIARFLLITGMRRAEACGLRWAVVDMDGGRITVHGKGDRVDTLPLTGAAMAILRGEQGRSAEFVFTYQVRHKWGGKLGSRVPIAPDTLGTAFWRARRAAGLADADLRLHDIRHTAATRLVRATGNLGAAQKMLRHSRITTTMRYAHVTDDDLRAAMEKAAPVAAIVETPAAEKQGQAAEPVADPAKKNAG